MAKTLKYGLGAFKSTNSSTSNNLESRVTNLENEIVTGNVLSINQQTGNITCTILSRNAGNTQTITVGAFPFFPNIKNYPIIGEAVLIIKSISPEYQSSLGATSYYYLSPLNIWNEPNNNALILPNQYPTKETTTNTKSYQEIELGSSNKSQPNAPKSMTPGVNFPEKGNIVPLYSFEGDVIFEGRWGNTIRFGSTNTNSPLSNSWSNLSQYNGDPITIIDNTRNNNILESFSNDSSIWLTSTQKLPITGSSVDYTSYTQNQPIALNQYSGQPQIVLNSGRLVFNTTQDHLMLSSIKTINLNSVEGVNIDTRGNFVIQSSQVYLGDSEDSLTQPVVLGDDLVSLLTDILDDLSTLTRSLQNQVGVPVGTPLAPTSLTAQLVADKIPSYKRRVSQLLSNTTRTAV